MPYNIILFGGHRDVGLCVLHHIMIHDKMPIIIFAQEEKPTPPPDHTKVLVQIVNESIAEMAALALLPPTLDEYRHTSPLKFLVLNTRQGEIGGINTDARRAHSVRQSRHPP